MGETSVSISAYQFKGHVIEIHNRRANYSLSTGNKLAFKQLMVVGSFYQHTLQHTYDTVSRLKQTAYRIGDAVTGTPFREYNFTYDLAGNRTNQTVKLNGVMNSNVNYTYNNFNQLISDGVNNYTYDANGNLSTINGAVAYTWDRANRLLSYGGSAYTYNGVGHRLSQTVGGNVTQYLQDVQPGLSKLLSATTGANTTHYIHDPLGVHAQRNQSSAWDYMLADGLGSVRQVIDDNANSVATMQYAPYGEIWDSTGTQPNFKFTGEQTDSNGLIYLRARHLNPSLGVFPSLDPLELKNRYAYANNNPTTLTDPSGYTPLLPACIALFVFPFDAGIADTGCILVLASLLLLGTYTVAELVEELEKAGASVEEAFNLIKEAEKVVEDAFNSPENLPEPEPRPQGRREVPWWPFVPRENDDNCGCPTCSRPEEYIPFIGEQDILCNLARYRGGTWAHDGGSDDRSTAHDLLG